MENPGIEVRGERYALPTLDTITLSEERVLFVYGDCVVRDFIPAHPEASEEERETYERLQLLRIRNPDFKRALAHIALRRAHADMEDAEVWNLAGEANALEADIAMLWGDGPNPQTTSQTPPESKRTTSEPSSSTDSGRSTPNGSGRQDESRSPTGTSGSDTSSPGAPPIALVS